MDSPEDHSAGLDAGTLEGSRSPRNRKALLVINLLVTCGLLGWLLARVDWTLMVSSLERLRMPAVALSLLCFLSIGVLEMMRLRVVLTPFDLRWRALARLHVVGTFLGNFLPGQLGSDLYKVLALRRLDKSVARPLSLILLLRAVGLIVLVAAALAGLAIYAPTWLERDVSIKPGVALAVQAVLVATVVFLAVVLAWKRLRANLATRAGRLSRGAREALRTLTVRSIATLIALSLLVLAARALVLYFLTTAVGSTVAFADAIFVVALATLVTLLPISFAGWGLREGALTLLLTQLALAYEDAVLVALAGRALLLALSVAGALWLLYETGFGNKPSATGR